MYTAGTQHCSSGPYPSPDVLYQLRDDTDLEDDHRNVVRVGLGQLQLPKLQRCQTGQLQLSKLRGSRLGHSRCLRLGSVILLRCISDWRQAQEFIIGGFNTPPKIYHMP